MDHIAHVVRTYPVFLALTIALIVQVTKGTTYFVVHRQLDFQRFVQTGGMPSAHSASVAALTTAVALSEGMRSMLFSVTLYFSLIVMYDATGLRRAAGRQAALLNRLVEQQPRERQMTEHRLWELLGHTPLEVLVGAIVGIAYALAWFRL